MSKQDYIEEINKLLWLCNDEGILIFIKRFLELQVEEQAEEQD